MFNFVSASYKEVVEILTKEAKNSVFFDLIIMDCNIPIMDVFEATRLILELVNNKKIPLVPIIASNANASPLF